MERIWWKYKATRIHENTFKARLALFLQCMKATDIINKRMNKRMNNAHGEKRRENGEGRERKQKREKLASNSQVPRVTGSWNKRFWRVWGWVKAHQWLRMHVSRSSLIKGQRTVWGLVIIAWNKGNILKSKFCDPAHLSCVHVCGWLSTRGALWWPGKRRMSWLSLWLMVNCPIYDSHRAVPLPFLKYRAAGEQPVIYWARARCLVNPVRETSLSK